MEPITRRRALQLGGLGIACTAAGAIGLGWGPGSQFDPVASSELTEPPVLRSAGGALEVVLECALGPVTVAGRQATTLSYNGSLPGPTIHLQPGDRLRVQLVNRLDAPTNLHVHGLHVSPQGRADDVFVMVEPGGSHDYEYEIPSDHPPGVYWYHPHHHGNVADQLFGGMYGAIIVGDVPSAAEPAIPVTSERVMVISDISLDGAGAVVGPSQQDRMVGREGQLVLVNGQLRPLLTARPGERQRWRVVNACAARYLRLRLDGQQLQLVGMDSGHYPRPLEVTEVSLAPGNRADLLVTTTSGTSELQALPVDRGRMMGMGGSSSEDTAQVLAQLTVSGAGATSLPPLPSRAASRDLRAAEVATRRTLVFANGMGAGMGMGGMRFTIDGREFDPNRVDQSVRLGTVEEWTITSTSEMDHPMHLHVWPMQVIQQQGQPVELPTWRDVVNIPARGSVTVRVAFDDFAGRTVYHCHILDHEDLGMMGVIEVR